MLPVLTWIDKHTEEEDVESGSCIYDLAFKPDGTQLLVAIGRRIIVYDPNDGSVIISLQAHKELVYAVAFSYNGEHYASGSQDKTVIIWNEKHQGLLKYSHNEAIQCLAFSPKSDLLLSCAVEDFGIWLLKDTNVSKQKVNSRCTCCQWSTDGMYYAIGFYDGTVVVRSTTGFTPAGEEVSRIERPGKDPVWSLQFASISTSNIVQNEMLVVADWSQSVGFYTHENGKLVHKVDKSLDYDPTSVYLFNNGCFFLTTGSNKNLNLHTKEGNDLGAMAQLDAWPWCMAFRQKPYSVVVGCIDGSLACYQLMLNTIHALHKDLYAFRENQTDVVVQQLQKQKSTRICCNDLVRKVAIYNNRLAVQLTNKIVIYRQSSDDKENGFLDYRLLNRINQIFDCSLLVVCTNHVILCQDCRLTCYDLKGIKQREWVMESLIRYIKVVGGPPGRETILVGMRYGLVSKIFVDNPFPIEIVRLKSMIRCVDISISKRKLATVDEESICVIYNTETKEILNQEPNISSVAFNCENENLICYSGGNILNIKSLCLKPYQQKLEPLHQGFVVGFMGKCVYILHMYSMQCVEISLTSQIVQFLENKMFKEAYALACLGVTKRDWQMLGEDALESLEFTIAKKAFHRLRNSRALILIYELEEMQIRGASPENMRALIYAHHKRFRQAVQLLQATNDEQKALEIFADLRMFDQAQEFLSGASNETQRQLLQKKARWAHDSNDMQMAADLLMVSGDYAEAIRIMINNDWVERVANAARKLDCSNASLLREIGNYLTKRGDYTTATSIFTRIHDLKSIVRMHVEAEHWEDALAIVKHNPSLNSDAYLPYARWLAEQDQFDDAQKAYNKAGEKKEATQVLQQLTENAVHESRFHDASCYYRTMAVQLLDNCSNDNFIHQQDSLKKTNLTAAAVNESNKIYITKKWNELIELADIYYVYDAVFKYAMEPFTDKSLDVLFNMARFLAITKNDNYVSQTIVLFNLLKLSQMFDNFKTARHALDQLNTLRVPPQYKRVIDVASLEIRAKPFSDSEQFQPMCYSCGTINPILGGHNCVHCDSLFIYSFTTLEVLPIVEVALAEGINDFEAFEMIKAEPPSTFDIGKIAINRGLVKLSLTDLQNLASNMVFVCTFDAPIKTRYFVKVIEEISIIKCTYCQKLFHADDFQIAVFQSSQCPVCRVKINLLEEDSNSSDEAIIGSKNLSDD